MLFGWFLPSFLWSGPSVRSRLEEVTAGPKADSNLTPRDNNNSMRPRNPGTSKHHTTTTTHQTFHNYNHTPNISQLQPHSKHDTNNMTHQTYHTNKHTTNMTQTTLHQSSCWWHRTYSLTHSSAHSLTPLTHPPTYTCTYVCMCVCMYVCSVWSCCWVCVCVCVCVCICRQYSGNGTSIPWTSSTATSTKTTQSLG